MTRFKKYIDSFDSNPQTDIKQLRLHLPKLEQSWTEFDNHSVTVAEAATPDCIAHEEKPAFVPAVKLSVITIPTFSGRYDDCLCFYDTFPPLIHNITSLSGIPFFFF
ncbi:hypothetical protein PR048_030024 [Dryococelus australis]|uniref:Uncharacterized protein n=1 Tax=Dryococelus australis TaxID=614101 RepID=A0ABQ9GAF8_9NEOP|nr:hypothetical protein PR048_030024 [Dryococelus australis]